METLRAMQTRRLLRTHPLVTEALLRFWSLFRKNFRNCVPKKEYLRVLIMLCKVLNPEFNEKEARQVVMVRGWPSAVQGAALTGCLHSHDGTAHGAGGLGARRRRRRGADVRHVLRGLFRARRPLGAHP